MRGGRSGARGRAPPRSARQRPPPLQQTLVRIAIGPRPFHLLRTGRTIEELGLRRAVEQPQRAVLPVDLDQPAPISPSAVAVVSWPPIRAEPRPSAAIDRARMTSPSSAHSSAPSGASNRACTFAAPAPSRTRCAPPRAPIASEMPVAIIVLPAPVSPVSTVSPGAGSTSSSPITPRPVMWSCRSTGAS
jgi:hypothetical protein